MDGESRRKEIEALLQKAGEPLSGTALAKRLNVSRQVIVQDIALLRATNKNILSTSKGYLIFGLNHQKETRKRIIAVKHDDKKMKEELEIIVDAGARVLDVVVDHEVYGQIAVDLLISSRKDVEEFIDKIQKNKMRPLKELTGGMHYHTIEAETEESLDLAKERLREKGILIS